VIRLEAVRRFALGLPEVTEEPHFDKASFRVARKIFVTVPPGETHIHVFVGEALREPALALHPDSIEKLSWGGKVVGLRLDLALSRRGRPCTDTRGLEREGAAAIARGLNRGVGCLEGGSP